MLATFPTLTPNTDALTQWGDFSVTAPSGLVPWPAFYDGTETVTVSGWVVPSPSKPYFILNEWFITTNINNAVWYTWLWQTATTYLWNPIWFIIDLVSNRMDVIKVDLSNNSVSIIWWWVIPWWTWFNSAYLDWDNVYINIDWPNRYTSFNLLTNTLSWFISLWIYTSWILLSQWVSISWITYTPWLLKEPLSNNAVIYFKLT